MRLIGFGLLAFVMIGAALFLTNSETFRMGARGLSETAFGPRLVFETQAPERSNKGNSAVMYRAGPQAPLILTGLPAYQSATFYLPIDARPISGHLQIDATVQSMAGVEGALRISIGNTKRAELLLRPGEAGRSLRIQLTEQDIAREQLVVSFSLQGQGPHSPCGIDDGIETIVEIEATSAVFLETDAPLTSDRDAMLAAGRSVRVGWSDTDQALSLLAATDLSRSAIDVAFGEGGLTHRQAAELAAMYALQTAKPQYAWSDSLAPGASIYGARQFHRAHTWRLRYDMLVANDPRLPSQLNLRMRLGQQPGAARWHISVLLNGKLLEDRLTGSGDIAVAVALAAKGHQRTNLIEVRVASTYDAPGECNRGPELIAEILSDTNILPGPSTFSDPLIDLTHALAQGWTLNAEGLSAPETLTAAQLVELLPEPGAQTGLGPKVQVLGRGTDLVDLSNGRTGLQLLQFDTFGLPVVTNATDALRPMLSDVALLVDLDGAGL